MADRNANEPAQRTVDDLSPSADWAPYKNDPAEFARTLAGHSGFDAVARSTTPPPSYTTPPPSYSRLAHPRLTLSIPSEDEVGAPVTLPTASVTVPNSYAIESTDTSPIEDVQTSLATTETSLRDKLRSGLRKRRTGFRDRLRRTSAGSQNSSTSSSPIEPAPSLPSTGRVSESPSATNQSLPVIQELDGLPIHNATNTFVVDSRGMDSPANSHVRTYSSSSIVPTPRRGLSLSTPSSSPRVATMNAEELSGRLETLRTASVQRNPNVVVSPCSPISPSNRGFGSSLRRANAITDSVTRNLEPISPLVAVPPTTPTLDGRLDQLPRLALPFNNPGSTPRGHGGPSNKGKERASFATNADSNKEVVLATSSTSPRLERPFPVPQWSQPQNLVRAHHEASMDPAVNAPEFLDTTQSPVNSAPSAPWPMPSHSYTPQQPRPNGLMVEAICDGMVRMATASAGFIRQHCGPEPPVQEHHVRVRWRCACGEDTYDDYIENRAGAAAELEALLNHAPPPSWTHTPMRSQPQSAASSVFSPNGLSPASSASSWPSPHSPDSHRKHNWGGAQSPSNQIAHNTWPRRIQSYMDPLWLYTCLGEGKWCTKMRHIDVNATRTRSDRDLALALSSLHQQVNRGWLRLLKLRGLVNIRFVQFELHRNRFADISRSPCVPDPFTASGLGYDFEPTDLSPPVGSNYLMHLFKHPEDYDGELIAYARTPKRPERLDNGTGWGLELVEGFVAERIWLAGLVLALLGALVFMAAWCCGARESAAWVAMSTVAGAGAGLAWVQTVV